LLGFNRSFSLSLLSNSAPNPHSRALFSANIAFVRRSLSRTKLCAIS
jgi:hypothetical protein